MTVPTATEPIQMHTSGDVTPAEVSYARAKVASALPYARDPVLFAKVKLTRLADPAVARPAVAQVNLDINGRLIRAQTARPTMHAAIDEVHDRLRDRIRRAAGDWEMIRGHRALPHEWRHTSPPSDRPHFFPRPVEERQVLRHKTFDLARMTVDEAAFDMHMLDYQFHLFREDGTGVDSVLYRSSGPAPYRLMQLRPHPDKVTSGDTAVAVDSHVVPRLSVMEAIGRLNATGWAFVFFRDATTGRGAVLYHRYDGHYGLIESTE